MIPALTQEQPITAYAGLRPATQFKDYQIEALPERRWISVSGIRSTGLTGSLGIARHVVALHAASFEQDAENFHAPADPVWPRVPNLTEEHPRPYAQPGRSDIVCHCEMVTQDEIVASLSGTLPAGTIGGLRRRTRAMNGRCQGFYCSRRVLALASARIAGLVTTLSDAA